MYSRVTHSSTPIQNVLDATLGFASNPAWDYSKWTPDAVVILIGPNDELPLLPLMPQGSARMLQGSARNARSALNATVIATATGSAAELKSSKFIAAYLNLLGMVAANYKEASPPPKIVHVCGGSLNGLDPCSDIQEANRQCETPARPFPDAAITAPPTSTVDRCGHDCATRSARYGTARPIRDTGPPSSPNIF